MKKYILSLLVALLAGISTQAWGQLKPPPPVNPTITDIWKFAPKLDTGRHSAASFVIGTKLYVIMGDTTSWYFRGRIVAATWAYDTVTKTWTRKAPFPGKLRIGAAGFSINGKGYVGGGRNFMKPDSLGESINIPGTTFTVVSNAPKTWQRQDLTVTYTNAKGDSLLKDFWEYDPALDKWTQKADIPGTIMGRAYPVGFAFGNKGYIGLGYDNGRIRIQANGAPTSEVLGPYIDSIKHTQISAGPPPKYKIDTIMRQILKVTADSIYTDSIFFKRDLWEYDPGANTWTQRTDFPGKARGYATSFVLYDKACVGLGIGDSVKNAMFDDFYAFTPSTNTWKRITDFPASRRYGAGGWGIGFLGYVINGNDGLDRKDFYEYNDISQTWDRLPNKPDSARSLAIAGVIGRTGYYGTGAGIKKSYDNMFTWLIDTNRVTITSIPSGPFCGGQTITVGYKISSGITLGSGNVFTVQISDSLGSFFFPVDCGTFTSTNATGTFNVTIPTTTLEGNSYKFRIVASEPKMTGTPTMASFPIRQLPSVAGGPYAQSSCLKADAMFIVNAGGTNLTYQWRKGGVPISDGAKYAGTTNDSLIIKSTVMGDAGTFDVVISGTCNPPAMSPPATLTIQNIPPATITLQPLTDTICEGDSAKFKVAATGTAVNYRWLRGLDTLNNKDTVRNSPFVLGATTNELTITPTRLSDSGWYRCLVFENCGSKTYSDPVYLGFYLNTEIIDQPTNVDTVEFVNIGFKVSARGENLKYEWYKGSTKLSNGAKYDGADSDSLTVKNLQMGDVGFYQCYVTGDCGTVKKSLLGLLEIDPMPVIDEQPINTSDCEKSTVFFSVKVTGANIVYKWRKGGIPLVNGGKISGADLRTLVITDIDASDNGTYDCEVSTGPYTKVISAGGTLVVKPTPPKPVISSFGPDFIQSSTNGDIYRWYIDNVFEPSITVQTPKVTVIGDYRVRVTKDGCISELSDPYFWFPTTGIANINAGSLNLYPNPASNNVEVEIPSAITAGTVKVYDMLGKVVIEKDFTSSGNFALNIAQLREGMYVVAVVSENNSYVGRLVKQ